MSAYAKVKFSSVNGLGEIAINICSKIKYNKIKTFIFQSWFPSKRRTNEADCWEDVGVCIPGARERLLQSPSPMGPVGGKSWGAREGESAVNVVKALALGPAAQASFKLPSPQLRVVTGLSGEIHVKYLEEWLPQSQCYPHVSVDGALMEQRSSRCWGARVWYEGGMKGRERVPVDGEGRGERETCQQDPNPFPLAVSGGEVAAWPRQRDLGQMSGSHAPGGRWHLHIVSLARREGGFGSSMMSTRKDRSIRCNHTSAISLNPRSHSFSTTNIW